MQQTLYSLLFHLGPYRVRSKCVCLKTNALTLVKLGQMTHLMTWNEKKIEYKVGRDHQDLHFIYCPFFHLDKYEPILSTFVQIQDGFWSNLVKWQTKLLKMKKIEYQVVRYHQDLNFLYIQFFHLRKFKFTIPTKSWISHNYMKLYVLIVDFQLHLPNTLSNEKMVYILNVRFWWVEQYWY